MTDELYTTKNRHFNQADYTRARRRAKRDRFGASKPSTEKELIATANACIKKVIRTLQANGFKFSSFDLADMMQAGQLGLIKGGYYESGVVTRDTFRAISREIESRNCMRLNCRWEHTTGEFNLLEEIGACHEYQRGELDKLDESTRDAMRVCFGTLRASMAASGSRKKLAEFHGHRNFLIACISAATGKGNVPPINPATFRKRKSRFLTYLQCGAKELSGTLDKGQALAREILRNLELNAMSS